MQSSSANTI